MGYSFQGVFTNRNEQAVIDAAKRRWLFCTISKVESPFNGIAIYRHEEKSSTMFEQQYKDMDRLEEELPFFSIDFPETTFIFLWTDCHGGDCYYDGYACKNNKILIDNRGKGPSSFSRSFEREKLSKVLKTLDVDLAGSGYFEPFERGYLEERIISKPESVVESIPEKKKSWWQFWE